MTDIQKMIEEARNEAYHKEVSCLSITDEEFQGYRDGYDKGLDKGIDIALSQLQHANRWRKVSEELPEDSNKVWGIFLYDLEQYSGRTKGQVYYFNEKWWHEPIGSCKIEVEVTEWKTIE